MTVVPVNVPAMQKAEREASKQAYKTASGWIYPGKKTMRESNVHALKPHLARVDQLDKVKTEACYYFILSDALLINLLDALLHGIMCWITSGCSAENTQIHLFPKEFPKI